MEVLCILLRKRNGFSSESTMERPDRAACPASKPPPAPHFAPPGGGAFAGPGILLRFAVNRTRICRLGARQERLQHLLGTLVRGELSRRGIYVDADDAFRHRKVAGRHRGKRLLGKFGEDRGRAVRLGGRDGASPVVTDPDGGDQFRRVADESGVGARRSGFARDGARNHAGDAVGGPPGVEDALHQIAHDVSERRRQHLLPAGMRFV